MAHARQITEAVSQESLTRTAQEWVEEFGRRGEQSFKEEKRSELTVTLVNGALDGLSDLCKPTSKVARKLAEKGIDAELLAAFRQLAEQAAQAWGQLPPDRRRKKKLTAADKKLLGGAGGQLSSALKAVTDAARSRGDVDAARAFGRGVRFNYQSPRGLSRAFQQFFSGASTNRDLLLEAGMGNDELSELQALANRVGRLAQQMPSRSATAVALGTDLEVALLALDSGFDLVRARARTALRHKPAEFAKVLGILPHPPRPSHKSGSKKTPPAAPAATPTGKPATP